jgi:hypothetical protein
MGLKSQVGGDGTLFVGEDKVFKHVVYAYPYASRIVIDSSGWAMHFVVRKKHNSADPPILDKTATVSGVFNPDPALNTLVWAVTLTDTEMSLFTAKGIDDDAAEYAYSWKRTDDGSEDVTGYGPFVVEETTQR